MIYTKENIDGLLKVSSRESQAGEEEAFWIYLDGTQLKRSYEKLKGPAASHLVKYSVYGAPEPNTKLFGVALLWEGETNVIMLPHKYSTKGEAIGAANGLIQVPNVLEAHVVNIAASYNQSSSAKVMSNPELDPEKFAMLNGECG